MSCPNWSSKGSVAGIVAQTAKRAFSTPLTDIGFVRASNEIKATTLRQQTPGH